jgi:hypothetical protein
VARLSGATELFDLDTSEREIVSDKINQLAKEMRERALLITANPALTHKELQGQRLEIEKRNQIERVEQKEALLQRRALGRWR